MSPIRDKGKAYDAARSSAVFKKRFGDVRGEALTRPPRGFEADHPYIDDIKRKTFFAMEKGAKKRAVSAEFPDDVAAAMRDAKSLMKFLCDALGAPI